MAFEHPIRRQLYGLGNVQYDTPGGSGGGFINVAGARNGLTVDPAQFIVLGQNVGAVGNPGILLSDREIPMGGFSINNLTNADGFVKFSSVSTDSEIEIYRGNSGQTPITLFTLQGLNPAPGAPYGNFQLQIDESFINPDGQRDAAMSFGYNYNGVGGKVNVNEAAFSTVLESHFIQIEPQGQFEWYLQSVAHNGNADRIIFVVTQKQDGVTSLNFTADSVDWSNTVAQGAVDYATLNNGGLILKGPTTTFSMTPHTTLNDGALSITMTPGSNGEVLFNNFGTGGGNRFSFHNSLEVLSTAVKPNGFSNIDLRTSNAADLTRMCSWFQSTSGTEIASMWNNGNTSLNKLYVGAPWMQPNAFIQIAIASDGTPNTAPLSFAAGTLLTTVQDGTWEYDGTHLYFTIGVTRHTII